MAFEHKEGGATLFRNDKKGNDKAPDWRGDGLLNGKKVKLSGWVKDSSKGGFISLKIEEDNYKPTVKNVEREPNRDDDFGSSDIPF